MTQIKKIPKTRRAALATGAKFFNTGKPCKNGHYANRRTFAGNCVECQRISDKSRNFKLRSKIVEKRRKEIAALFTTYHCPEKDQIIIPMKSIAQFLDKIHRIYSGVSPEMEKSFHKLTPTQKKVVELLATGIMLKEIGYQLGMAESTVKTHIRAARITLGLKTNEMRILFGNYFTREIDPVVPIPPPNTPGNGNPIDSPTPVKIPPLAPQAPRTKNSPKGNSPNTERKGELLIFPTAKK